MRAGTGLYLLATTDRWRSYVRSFDAFGLYHWGSRAEAKRYPSKEIALAEAARLEAAILDRCGYTVKIAVLPASGGRACKR